MSTSTGMTASIFDDMGDDPRWFGFGYLGGRRNAMDDSDPESQPVAPDVMNLIDEAIISATIEQGWTADELFDWANSKDGRWFADQIFGCADIAALPGRFENASRYLRRQR